MPQRYTEQELVRGCQQQKPALQQGLYRQYHRKMYGVCLRYTHDTEDAMDVLQEGFIKVFANIKRFRGEGSLEGWIRRIMVHAAIEHYRKKSKYMWVDIEGARNVGIEAEALSSMSREEVLNLIQQLPVGYRTVFNLYVVEGYTHEEIGKMLKISAGTSKSQLSRAKGVLRELWKNQNQVKVG